MDFPQNEGAGSQPPAAFKQAHFLRDVIFHGKLQVRVRSVTIWDVLGL